MTVEIYTDGSCLKNPGGAGGWAALIRRQGEDDIEIAGGDPSTTNNRMEMMAVIAGLERLSAAREAVRINTDSQLTMKCGQGRWKRTKNLDLWERFDRAAAPHRIAWSWVRGHSGHPENDRVDRLARNAAKAVKPEAFPKSELDRQYEAAFERDRS